MIKFFRKIRQNLLMENKTSKYFKYAIGEIVLVVIGILIALQINNWNENRKSKQAVRVALSSLISDLKKDTLQLRFDIKFIDEDFKILRDFRKRLSHPLANMDSVKKIARFEFLPFFDPSHTLNRNTITSILSTGRIDDFDLELKNKILSHNSDQIKALRVMDQNVSIYLNNQSKYSEIVAIQSEHSFLDSVVVRGPLLDKYWQNKTDKDILDAMLTTITAKVLMYEIVRTEKKIIKENTEEMINYLNKYLDKF